MLLNAEFVWYAVLTLITALVCLSVLWRLLCLKYALPWPSFLAFMLENPYMLFISPSRRIVNRLELGSGMKVWDLGCGSGRISVPAAQEVAPTGVVYALDMQAAMLKKTENRASKFKLANLPCIKTNFVVDEFFDIPSPDRIVMVTVLGEMPKAAQKRLLKMIAERLASDGILSITEVIPDPCYLTKSQVKQLATEQGFVIYREYNDLLSYTLQFRLA